MIDRRHLIAGLAATATLAACAKTPSGGPTASSASPSSAGSSPSASPSGVAPSSTSPTTSTPTPSASSQPPSSSAPSSPTAASCAQQAAALPLATRCGQLLMVGVDQARPDSSFIHSLGEMQVGFALVLGNAIRGHATVSALSALLGGHGGSLPIVIAADQEGGQIQRLKGQGFSTIPSAVGQSEQSPATLAANWTTWGRQMASAGVQWNLAPCADVVPAAKVSSNAPVGQLRRYYGTTAAKASPLIVAAAQGMRKAGVATSVKHFPGLGQVTTNTDFGEAADTVTSLDSPELEAFRAAVKAGVDSVMISSAVYTQIDAKNRAVFSRTIIDGLLRRGWGYDGVVISDDLGAAASVADVPVGERATRFVAAGGDVVICADPTKAKPMIDALVAKAKADPSFEKLVTVSAGRVLALKASLKVLDPSCS